MDVTSESLLKMSSPSRRVYVEGTTSQPLSLPMLQAILEGLPAVKVLQVRSRYLWKSMPLCHDHVFRAHVIGAC